MLVGAALIISGTDDALEARQGMRATSVVDSVKEWRRGIVDGGATVVEHPTPRFRPAVSRDLQPGRYLLFVGGRDQRNCAQVGLRI